MSNEDSPMVKLAAITGGIFMIIVIEFLLAARDSLGLLVPIAWAFVVLGVILGAFQFKLLKKK